MESSRLSNPFARDSPFKANFHTINYGSHYHYESSKLHQPDSLYISKASYNSYAPNNPFETFQFQTRQNRRNMHSQNKQLLRASRSQNNLGFPLTKHENKIKLQQLDNEYWKREKQQEERYRLQHFGAQALRYSNYSTATPSLHYEKKPYERKIKKHENENDEAPVFQKIMSFHDEFEETEKRNNQKFFISAEKPIKQKLSPRFQTSDKQTSLSHDLYYQSQGSLKKINQHFEREQKDVTKFQSDSYNPNQSYGSYQHKINESQNSNFKNPYIQASQKSKEDNFLENSEGDMFHKRQSDMLKMKNANNYLSDSDQPHSYLNVQPVKKKRNGRNPYDSYISEAEEANKGPFNGTKWSDSEEDVNESRYRKIDRVKQNEGEEIDYSSYQKKNVSLGDFPKTISYEGKQFHQIKLK